jgi:hypothetical protein
MLNTVNTTMWQASIKEKERTGFQTLRERNIGFFLERLFNRISGNIGSQS